MNPIDHPAVKEAIEKAAREEYGNDFISTSAYTHALIRHLRPALERLVADERALAAETVHAHSLHLGELIRKGRQ